MLTVAKSIDAPIKLLFPRDWTPDEEGKPKFSLLGLGDIVLPGLFIALCLRYDIIKATQKALRNGSDKQEVYDQMRRQSVMAPKPYFYGSLIGYVIAIITTVAVMFIFDHGQPALLYLVPACLLSVVINALRLGETKLIQEFDEDKIVNPDKKRD